MNFAAKVADTIACKYFSDCKHHLQITVSRPLFPYILYSKFQKVKHNSERSRQDICRYKGITLLEVN